jgi:hypothetical protein
MGTLATATILGVLILLASMLSVELGLSVAIIEITLGVVAANFFGVRSTAWIDFLASFAGIVLTFLAGAEVDPESAAGGSSHRKSTVAAVAPRACAARNPGTSAGRIPANVWVAALASVTAGFANDVEAVNQ